MAKSKTNLPVVAESKWSKVIARHEAKVDEAALANKSKAIINALPSAKPADGKPLAQGLCLTCHAIGRTFPDGGRGSCDGR